MEPQAIIAIITLGLIAAMILLSKIFTKIWIYLLLSSPSWGISFYNIFAAAAKGESIESILFNHASGLLFILAPIDQYVVSDPSLRLYGLVLLAIWAYIILTASIHLLGGLGLPIAPLIWWLLGKGHPNTMVTLNSFLPDWLGWLTAYSGLPLILLACLTLGILLFFIKRRKR